MNDKPVIDSFAVAERCLVTTGERLPGFPQERVRLARMMAHIQRGMEQSSNRTLKPYGLNYSGYHALMMLYGAPDFSSTPSLLSEATGEKRTNMTRICDELLAGGFIERQPSEQDRRKVVLRLTTAGRSTLESLQPAMWAALDQLYGSFDAGEIGLFQGLLRRQLDIWTGGPPSVTRLSRAESSDHACSGRQNGPG